MPIHIPPAPTGKHCLFERCQNDDQHCDGACHGVYPDGSPLKELPELAKRWSKDDLDYLSGLFHDYHAYTAINGPLGVHGEAAAQKIIDFLNSK